VLVQLQHKCWQRWYRNVRMDLTLPEYELEHRKARVLLMVRDRTRNDIAFHFQVWRKLRRAFEAFVQNVDRDEDGSRRRSSTASASGVIGGQAVQNRRRQGRSAAKATSQRRGLRGTSTAEVFRKAWRRWRYVLAAEPFWEPSDAQDGRRPSGATESLLQIASKVKTHRDGSSHRVEDARRQGGNYILADPMDNQGNTFSPRAPMDLAASSSPHGLRNASVGRHRIEPEDPPHLALLQKTLAHFDRITAKTPPRQRSHSPAMSGTVVDLASRPFLGGHGVSDDAVQSLWSPSTPHPPGHVLRTAISSDSPRHAVNEPLTEETPRSPHALRRGRLTRKVEPDVAPLQADALWNSMTRAGESQGGVIDLTARPLAHPSSKSPSTTGKHRAGQGGDSSLPASGIDALEGGQDSSFVLTAHPSMSSPLAWESQDYGALSRQTRVHHSRRAARH